MDLCIQEEMSLEPENVVGFAHINWRCIPDSSRTLYFLPWYTEAANLEVCWELSSFGSPECVQSNTSLPHNQTTLSSQKPSRHPENRDPFCIEANAQLWGVLFLVAMPSGSCDTSRRCPHDYLTENPKGKPRRHHPLVSSYVFSSFLWFYKAS